MNTSHNARRRLATLLLAAALGLAACASRNPEFDALHDQGIIPVSRTNPYVGSNLYLAKEMEGSSYLYNFLKERGVPQAIEISGSSEADAELRLYYSAKNQVFYATPVKGEGQDVREWSVRGPYNLEREAYRAVSQLPAGTSAEFELWGRRETIGNTEAVASQRVILPAFVPTPSPRPRPRPSAAKRPLGAGEGPAITGMTTANQGGMTLDQLAIIEAKENVERGPNGDAIHTVRTETETIASISNWYAGSGDQAKKIAEKNNLPLDAKLKPGTRIFIQSELVTNSRVMK